MNPQLPQLLKDKQIHKLTSDLPDRVEEYINGQRPFATQCTQNRNFVNNLQWGVVLPGYGEIVEPLQDEGEVRLTYNIIAGMVNLLRAEILARPPGWQVQAYSGDQIKIENARIGEQVLRQYYYDMKRTGIIRENLDGIFIDGVSYLTADYFPNIGKVLRLGPQNEPIHEGRIIPRRISTYDLLVPDSWPQFNKAPCVCEIIRMFKEDVKARFKSALDYYKITDVGGGDDDRLRNDQRVITDRDKSEDVEVYKVWFLPGRGALPDDGRFPNGLGIVWLRSANKVLDIMEIPYPWNVMDNGQPMYPYVDFHFDRRHEKFHSQGVPEKVIPIQVELNRTISQLAEAKNYAGNLYWVASFGQVQSVDEFPTTQGGVLIHKPQPNMPPPHIEQPPTIPSYIQQMPQGLEAMANKVHSISDISYAMQPGSTNSQGGQEQMLNQQAKIFIPFAEYYGTQLSTFGRALLMMEQKYTDYDKELRVLDPVGDIGLRRFYSNLNLEGNFDVVVRIDTDPYDPVRRKAFALQELQQGGITKEQYDAIAHGEEPNAAAEMAAAYAEEENQQFLAGEIVDNRNRLAVDDHPVHYRAINRLINSDQFKQMPPQLQQAVMDHAYIHLFGMNAAPQVFQNVVIPRIQQLGIIAAQPPMVPPTPGNPAQGQQPSAQGAA